MHLDRVIEAAGWWSYAAVFVLTAGETSAFIGLLVPGETAVLLASAVAGRGELNAPLLAAVVVAGAVTGDNLGYALGRRCARRPGRRSLKALVGHRDGRARAFLTRHGAAAVFTGKFIGFARTFLPYAAGSSGMPYRRFLLYSTTASLLWGIGTVLLGFFAGAAATGLLRAAGTVAVAAVAAVTVPALVVKVLARRRRHRPVTRSRVVACGGPRRPPARGAARESTRSREG
ncbi:MULTISPECIES: DedA family protein [Streptomyces]|uniref:DedA family protein n=1 Tax=Streptomyces flaveolus TaxID=67297 RepID=A0ABV3ALS3_9ACTN|nr:MULTISPECIES: DedA family protein [Streptomyces]